MQKKYRFTTTTKLYSLDNLLISKKEYNPNNFTGIIENDRGTKIWFMNGKCHRIDGHAIQLWDGTKQWWINDVQVTEEQHRLYVDTLKLKSLI